MNAADPFATPEVELLLLCARRARSVAEAATVKRLAAGPLDWRFVLGMASRHRVLALLHSSLSCEGCLELIPPAARQTLHSAVRECIGQSLALTAELVRILREFESAGIPAIPCKGPVVAMAAYGDISYRSFCDLDILVPEAYFHSAYQTLSAAGYRPEFRLSSKQEKVYLDNECAMQFRNDVRGHIVELHWRFFERNASVHLPVASFSQRATQVSLPGMPVRSLAPEDQILYLCVHGAKHRWERLEWIACVAEIARRNPRLDWPATFERAERYRVYRFLKVGLLLAASLLGAELPAPVLARLTSDSRARELADWVKGQLLAPPCVESHYQERATRYLYMMRSRESWLDRARILFRSAIRPPHPSAHEWMNLPPRLAFLHHVFRPVRLLGEYSMVAWKHYLGSSR